MGESKHPSLEDDRASAYRRVCGYWNRGQPLVNVRFAPLSVGEELVLELVGNGATGAGADLDAIDRANRSNFRGGSHEEHFLREVQHLAGNLLFGDWNAQIAAQ